MGEDRRNGADRVRRRRGGRFGLSAAIFVLVGAAVVLITLVSVDDDAAAPSLRTLEITPSSTAPASTTSEGRARAVQGAVDLEEVWLIDRGDGTYDWGVTVESLGDVDRGAIEVRAELLGADGAIVATDRQRIGALTSGASAVIGGQVQDPVAEPRRIEVEVSPGDVLDDPPHPPEVLRIVAVERRRVPGGGPDEEAIVGRIHSADGTDLEDLRLALLWRDASGNVVASRFRAIDRVRPGVEARFEVPIGDDPAAEGVPDEISWSHGPHSE